MKQVFADTATKNTSTIQSCDYCHQSELTSEQSAFASLNKLMPN